MAFKDPSQQREYLKETGQFVPKRPRKDLEKWEAENVQPGDSARYLRYALASWDLPPIDLADPEQVKGRIRDYFEFCAQRDRKPSVVGMANWIGVSRDTLDSWRRGECRSNTHSDIIKKAYMVIEELWHDYMQNGKMNPVTGIFIAKNFYGYRDQQDVVITPNNPLGQVTGNEELAQRYMDSIASGDDMELLPPAPDLPSD